MLLNTGFEKNTYPTANTISAEDLSSLITILRIVSGFLRTHKYPAFPTGEEFDHAFAEQILETKRPLTTGDDYMVTDQAQKKRMVSVKEDGEATWGTPDLTSEKAEIKIYKAKPVVDSTPSWGGPESIPTTDGMVFPYIEELAVWDKETVCSVIGLHFVRCLGHTTDGCLKAFSDLCQHWKRSLYRSPIGNVLSHLFKVISIGIPAQARIFPVIVDGKYSGCYLSGSGYSVALKGDLYRPVSYDNNEADFDCFDSMQTLMVSIAKKAGFTPDEFAPHLEKAMYSMRGLDFALKKKIITVSKLEAVRTLAARLRYPQEYLRINMDNIQLAVTLLKDGKEPHQDIPMHSSALGRRSQLELVLSAFGPTAPSPNIPGSSRLPVTPKPPPNFNKMLAFRTTSLETAISDWKDFGERGIVYNGPERLSGRYQYIQVRGEAERDKWFSTLNSYHVWYLAEQRKGLDSAVVDIDFDETVEGGVLLGLEAAIDLSGF
jgi:hypothetical protein